MPPATATQGSSASVTDSAFSRANGREIYDRLMQKIEPELVTENLQNLDAPYPDESPADRKARYKRYAAAFEEYSKAYATWLRNLKQAVSNYKRAVTKAVEKVNRGKENDAMKILEDEMSKA